MKRPATLVAVILGALLLDNGWPGERRSFGFGSAPSARASPVALDPADPQRRRVGGLTWLGGVALTGSDRAFGSFSAMAVAGRRFLLLSDGGHVVRFTMGADWRPRGWRFDALPAGPGTGAEKRDRDSESLARDPHTGRVWIGFESANAIWRYGADGIAGVEPAAMAGWRTNGGAESLARLADGRFVAISEEPPHGARISEGLVWAGDPVEAPEPAFRFGYRAAPGHRPVDLAELPDGRLLVLERSLRPPFRWASRLALVERSALRPGAVVQGATLATLAAPLIHENFEGMAVTREGGATVVWLVSDDNWLPVQTTYLLKFRLDD